MVKFDSIKTIKKENGKHPSKQVLTHRKTLSKLAEHIFMDISSREKKSPLTYRQKCAIYHRLKKSIKKSSSVGLDELQEYLAYYDESLFKKLTKFFTELYEEVYVRAISSPLYFDFLYAEVQSLSREFFTFGYTIKNWDAAVKKAIKSKVTGWDGYWMIEFSPSGKITRVWGSGTSDFEAVYYALFKDKPYKKVLWKAPKRKNYHYKKRVQWDVDCIKKMIRADSNQLRVNIMKAHIREIETTYKLK
jgi:hypothetical protein